MPSATLVSYRLEARTRRAIDELAAALKVSRTEVVTRAVEALYLGLKLDLQLDGEPAARAMTPEEARTVLARRGWVEEEIAAMSVVATTACVASRRLVP